MKTIRRFVAALVSLLAVAGADAGRTLNGSSEYVRFPGAPTVIFPLTIAVWVRPSSSGTIAALCSSSDNNTWYRITFNAGTEKAYLDQNSPYIGVTSTGTLAVGTWGLIAGVWYSGGTSRAVFVNTDKTTEGSSGTPASVNRFTVGVLDRPTIQEYFGGDVAEAAVWNVALTDAEMASLAAGCSALRIRSASLVFYAPLIGKLTAETDYRGGVAATTTGGSSAGTHPRIYK